MKRIEWRVNILMAASFIWGQLFGDAWYSVLFFLLGTILGDLISTRTRK